MVGRRPHFPICLNFILVAKVFPIVVASYFRIDRADVLTLAHNDFVGAPGGKSGRLVHGERIRGQPGIAHIFSAHFVEGVLFVGARFVKIIWAFSQVEVLGFPSWEVVVPHNDAVFYEGLVRRT